MRSSESQTLKGRGSQLKQRLSSFFTNTIPSHSRSFQQEPQNSFPADSTLSQRRYEDENGARSDRYVSLSRPTLAHPEQDEHREQEENFTRSISILSHSTTIKRKSQDMDMLMSRRVLDQHGSRDASSSVSSLSDLNLDIGHEDQTDEEWPQTLDPSTRKRQKHDSALTGPRWSGYLDPLREPDVPGQDSNRNIFVMGDKLEFFGINSPEMDNGKSRDQLEWARSPRHSYQTSHLGPSETDESSENRYSISTLPSSDMVLDNLDEYPSFSMATEMPPFQVTISTRNDTNPLSGYTYSTSLEDYGFGQQPSSSLTFAGSWEAYSGSQGSTGSHSCAICHDSYATAANLEIHAKHSGHKAFACTEPNCHMFYLRQDSFLRHCASHKETNQYPCQHCDKYEGAKAFKRRDHLLQHMRKRHPQAVSTLVPQFCSEQQCPYSKASGSFKGFRERSEYTRHMREMHGKGTYECGEPGCKRVGRKGFRRLNDLEKHKIKEHAGA
jgi:hypothetical protein